MSQTTYPGIRGHKMSADALKATVSKKLNELAVIISILEDGGVVKPGARLDEAKFLCNVLKAIRDDSWELSRILKSISALPATVGKVPVLNEPLGVHVGILETHYLFENTQGKMETEPILGVKKNVLDKDEPWMDYYELMEKLNDAPERHGWKMKQTMTNGFAYVICPGWATVDGDNYVDHHECGKLFLSSEGWHGWRCEPCNTEFKMFRKTYRSNGNAEKQIVRMTNKFLKGELKRIIRPE